MVEPYPYTPSQSNLSGAANVSQVLTAPIDTILINEEMLPVELITDLIFENLAGQELLSISRNDTINGQKIIYQPIKNLNLIQQEYNPNNILNIQATSDKYFNNFTIKFDPKVPNVGDGPNGDFIYIDPNSGDLVIDFINIEEGEQAQVEILADGTIYEVQL